MKIDVNKKYKTVRGDIVVFNRELENDIRNKNSVDVSNMHDMRTMELRKRRPFNGFDTSEMLGEARSLQGSLFYGVLINNGRDSGCVLCWGKDGTIVRASIPHHLLPPSFSREETYENTKAFNLVENEYTNITQYFTDKRENFNKLVLDYKDAHNVLFNTAKGICTNGTSKDLTEKINQYDNLSREIISILERDIDVVNDMEIVDTMLLYTVENELKKFTESIENFNASYLNAIKLSIAFDVYGYVPVENNNHVKIIPMVMTDGSVKLFGQDGKEIKADENA